MKRICLLFLTLIPCIVFAQSLISGYSLKNKEQVYVVGTGYDLSNEYFIKNEKVPIARNIHVLGFYFAYGLKKEFNIITSYSLIDMTPQDLKLGVSKQILKKQHFVMVSGFGFFGPTKNYQTEGLFAVGQQAKGLWTEQIFQWRKNSAHVDFSIGFNYTQSPTPSNLPIGITYGQGLKKCYYKVFGLYQYSNSQKYYRGKGEESPNTFRELGVNFVKIGGQLIYTSKSWQPYITVAKVLYGQNVFAANTIFIGIIKKW